MLKDKHMNTIVYRTKNPLLRILAMVAIGMAFLFACGMGQRGSAPPPELSVDVLLTGTQGIDSHQEASAEWIASLEELEQLLAGQNASQMPAHGISPIVLCCRT